MRASLIAALSLFSLPLLACAAGKSSTGGFGGGGAGTTSTTGSTSDAASTSTASQGGGGGVFTTSSTTSSTGSGTMVPVDIYAHTADTLFRFDPMSPSAPPALIGKFDCIGGTGQDSSITDIAVSGAGELWGISTKNVYRLEIQGSKVHCATTIPLQNAPSVRFFGLTFAPAGVLDPQEEVLVAGNTAGELWSIDTTTGKVTQHGNFGLVPANDGNGHSYPVNPGANTGSTVGKPWELSGDIVFLFNNGSPVGFATVRDCPSPPDYSNCDRTDTLIEIDMNKLKTATTGSVTLGIRGAVVQKAGCTDAANPKGYGAMFGIVALNDKVYGFSSNGALVEINNDTGAACLVQDSTYVWYGAGITTTAPVIAPPPPK